MLFEHVSVADAAKLLGVVEQTVRNHLAERRLLSESVGAEPITIGVGALRAAKLLRPIDLAGRPHDLKNDDVLAAKLAGVVRPEDGRFSLDDVDAVRAWIANGRPKARPYPTDETTAPTTNPSDAPHATGGEPRTLLGLTGSLATALDNYLLSGGSPSSLPDGFWLTPLPPPYVPPRDTYRSVVHASGLVFGPEGVGPEGDEEYGIAVYRSDHTTSKNGKLVQVPAATTPVVVAEELEGLPSIGKPPPQDHFVNERWHLHRREWILCWEARADLRKSHRGGAGGALVGTLRGPNRAEMLDQYHLFFDRPGDLPHEFWEGDEIPPFDPPTNVLLHRLGARRWRVSDGCRTAETFVHVSGWVCLELGGNGPAPVTHTTSIAGHFEEGDPCPELDELNAAYWQAEREHRDAYRRFLEFRQQFG